MLNLQVSLTSVKFTSVYITNVLITNVLINKCYFQVLVTNLRISLFRLGQERNVLVLDWLD